MKPYESKCLVIDWDLARLIFKEGWSNFENIYIIPVEVLDDEERAELDSEDIPYQNYNYLISEK